MAGVSSTAIFLLTIGLVAWHTPVHSALVHVSSFTRHGVPSPDLVVHTTLCPNDKSNLALYAAEVCHWPDLIWLAPALV